ncbi:MAG: hypothetical protein DRR06_17635 [Gammaproteobacteria bacterium]|nr:MAG: hypothetical protein DRR06_17635 [Gammaproteobacteria bacterium]
MSTLNHAPSGLLSLPYIEAQYANPRLAVYLKCLLYSQIRIDVAPHIMADKHWITQVKALIKDHYLNWQRHHSDHLALNGYTLFIKEGRSIAFSISTEANTGDVVLRVASINNSVAAKPSFKFSSEVSAR